jgi:hypothetical protein
LPAPWSLLLTESHGAVTVAAARWAQDYLVGAHAVLAEAWPWPKLHRGEAAASPGLRDSLARPPVGATVVVYAAAGVCPSSGASADAGGPRTAPAGAAQAPGSVRPPAPDVVLRLCVEGAAGGAAAAFPPPVYPASERPRGTAPGVQSPATPAGRPGRAASHDAPASQSTATGGAATPGAGGRAAAASPSTTGAAAEAGAAGDAPDPGALGPEESRRAAVQPARVPACGPGDGEQWPLRVLRDGGERQRALLAALAARALVGRHVVRGNIFAMAVLGRDCIFGVSAAALSSPAPPTGHALLVSSPGMRASACIFFYCSAARVVRL